MRSAFATAFATALSTACSNATSCPYPMPTDANCTNRAYAHGEQSSEVSRMPTGESTAATESTGSLPSLPSLVLFSVSTQPWHAALARRPGTPSTPSKCTSRCRVISITFPSHDSDDIPISLPPHASRPAASNLSNFSVFRDSKSGTSNTTSNAAYARRCMLWRWPRPQLQRPHSCGCLHDCCSCPRKQFYVAEIETVQNFQNETRNGSELVTQKRNGSELLLWKTKRFRISNTKTKRFRIAVMKNETVQNWKHKNETV